MDMDYNDVTFCSDCHSNHHGNDSSSCIRANGLGSVSNGNCGNTSGDEAEAKGNCDSTDQRSCRDFGVRNIRYVCGVGDIIFTARDF